MNKIGIHFGYFNKDWETDFFKQITQVKRLGFDILEIAPDAMMRRTESERQRIAEFASEKDISLTFSVGLAARYDLASENDEIRKAGIDYTIQALKIMNRMKIKMYSGVDYGAWNTTFTEKISDKRPAWERSLKSIREIMKTAEELDITYAVEVVNRYEQGLLNTAEEAVEYVKQADSPNVKILLDTYHMNIEEDDFLEAIHTAGRYLAHFHVGEANRKPPSLNGRMPWEEITGALKDISYDGAIVMEPFIKMGGEVGRDIKVWRDISKGADEAEMEEMVRNSIHMLRQKMAQ